MSAPAEAVGTAPVLSRLDKACHDPLRDLWAAMDSELWHPVQTALTKAVAGHDGAQEALGESCPDAPVEAVTALRRYVAHVHRDVHAPLLETLRDVGLPNAVQRLVGHAGTRSRDAANTLARDVPLALDRAALRGTPRDGWGRRLAKASARWFRRPPDVRPVDVRELARWHRSSRLAPGEHGWTLQAMLAWARWTADLASAWSAWAEQVLPAVTAPLPADAEEADTESGGEDGKSSEAEPWEPWTRVAAAGLELEAALTSLAGSCPHGELRAGALQDLEGWKRSLEDDVALAGTRVLSLDAVPPEPKAPADVGSWSRWLGQGLARLEFHAALMDVVLQADSARRRAVDRLADALLRPLEVRSADVAGRLQELTGGLSGTGRTPASGLREVRVRAEQLVEDLGTALRAADGVEYAIGASADAVVSDLVATVRRLPETVLLHGLHLREGLQRPTDVVRTVHLQEVGRQAFDALRMERLRMAPSTLTAASDGLPAAVGEVGEIVAFGFDAAATEMDAETPEAAEQSLVLATEGLERAADAARQTPSPLRGALGRTDRLLDEELTAGCRRLVDRALAQRVQGQLLDARSQLATTLSGWREGMGRRWSRGLRWLQLVWARSRRSGNRLVRWVRARVGAPAGSRRAGARTARRLADADALHSELPLVYQRLFDPGPVTDPALLIGRDVELADLEARLGRWQREDEVPVLVTGHRGVGISSFFNVCAERARGAGRTVVHHELDDRHVAESDLASELAEILGVGAQETMDGLAAAILHAPEDRAPEVVFLEGLEHLYLRVSGGTDLLERVLTLMAETEPRMFWVASLTSSAWQIIEKTEPTAVAQVDRLELEPLGPESTQSAVLVRHRRSGVPLKYERPSEGRRLLSRRLRRARGHEARQAILEADLFDTLHRTSQGNLRLTLYRWLRACDFAAVEGELRIRPLEPLDFSYLEELDLTQNFTLKAFLEHGTMTLEEHDRVFRLPRQESYQIFESLQNRRIIRPLASGDGNAQRGSEVTDDLRYGIRPLLTGAVAAHLATRNIVH